MTMLRLTKQQLWRSRFCWIARPPVLLAPVCLFLATSQPWAPQAAIADDPCDVSTAYDKSKLALAAFGKNLSARLKRLDPVSEGSPFPSPWDPDPGDGARHRPGSDLQAMGETVAFARSPRPTLPEPPGDAPVPGSLQEVEQQLDQVNQAIAAHRARRHDRSRSFSRYFLEKDYRSPESLSRLASNLEAQLSDVERKLLAMEGGEEQRPRLDEEPHGELARLLPGVNIEAMDLTDYEELDKLRRTMETHYQVDVPHSWASDRSWVRFVDSEVETLLVFAYFDDQEMRETRDRLRKEVRFVRQDPEQLMVYKESIEESAKMLAAKIRDKQRTHGSAIKDLLDGIEAKLHQANRSGTDQNEEQQELRRTREQLREEIAAVKEWRQLILEGRALDRSEERWYAYRRSYEKYEIWKEARGLFEQWNKARRDWASVRETRDRLVAEASALLESGEDLDSEKEEIEKAVVEDQRSQGEELCRKLTEKIRAYKRSATKDPRVRAQLREAKEKYLRLYGELQGWKESPDVREAVQEKIAEVRRRKANELSGLARQLEAYSCLEGVSALAGRLTRAARVVERGAAGDTVALPDLKLSGRCQLEEVPFYVVFSIYLPQPAQWPDTFKRPLPKGKGRETAKRRAQIISDRVKYVQKLGLANTTFMAFPAGYFKTAQQSYQLFGFSGDDVLAAFPRERFEIGGRFAFRVNFKEQKPQKGDGKPFKGVLLAQVAGVYDTEAEASASHGIVGKASVAQITQSDGTFVVKSEKGTVDGQFLTDGWSSVNQKDAMDFAKVLYSLDASGLCFIATAVYGDPRAPEVEVLRQFRDRVLMGFSSGRELIRLYYRHGPWLATVVARTPWLGTMVRWLLDSWVAGLGPPDIDASGLTRASRAFLAVFDRVTPVMGLETFSEQDGPPPGAQIFSLPGVAAFAR